ncbi:hypothetical protein EBU99_07760 [bacterium]|nr:hypothetical protein [bacterium]
MSKPDMIPEKEVNPLPKKKAKHRKIQTDINPHRHIQSMDELPVDLGKELERRMDTRTNAHLMGITGGVGPGIDSGSDLNSLNPGESDETEYEPITDGNLLTETSYINAVFQDPAVLHEDEVTARQHQHKKRTVSNKLETDRIDEIPASHKEESAYRSKPGANRELPEQSAAEE